MNAMHDKESMLTRAQEIVVAQPAEAAQLFAKVMRTT
jgi:hypothetical protein